MGKKKARNDKQKKDKKDNPKGYVMNEVDCLLTDDFVKQESNKTIVSDAKYRDKKEGYHYLGPMKTVCGYCGALGFEAEVQIKMVKNSATLVSFVVTREK